MSKAWINPQTGQASCPGCDGFGYLEDEDETECGLCGGTGVAQAEDVEGYDTRGGER